MLLKKVHIRKQGSVQETEYILFSNHLGRLTIFLAPQEFLILSWIHNGVIFVAFICEVV